WKAVQKDAEFAREANGGTHYHGSLRLLAKATLMQTREGREVRQRGSRLETAINHCTSAIALMEKNAALGEELDTCLIERSTARTELANCMTDPRKQRELLSLALADAEAVLKGKPSLLNKVYALCAKGNVLEDFAWLLHEDVARNYAKAVAEFDQAQRLLDIPYCRLNAGRARCKWAMFGLEVPAGMKD